MDISTLGYAILSLLARFPLSGYDIAREMRRPKSFFFGHAHVSQIYPELSHLERDKLVTSLIIEQQGKPDKKIYTISEAGLEALQQWVTQPPTGAPERSELLLKTYTIWLANPEHAIRLFQIEEDHHRARLAH